MLKTKILLYLCATLIVIPYVACSDSNGNDDYGPLSKKEYPLNSFAVKVRDSYYHAKIDQAAHTITIGSIEDSNVITGVEFSLLSDAATISPDPSSFIGSWDKEEEVTVTTEDQIKTTYKIILSKFKENSAEVLFRDDFDTPGNPDPDKWVLCPKGTSEWNDEMSASYDQAYVENGNLVLMAIKDENGEYKAGGIKTEGKFSFTFGKLEVRARITKYPNGAFPAIWLMPQTSDPNYTGWPNGGEIDVMEHVKQEANIHHTIHTHYTYDLKQTTDPVNSKQVPYLASEYNIYGMEWTAEAISFYVNGQKTFTYSNKHLPDEATMKQWPFTANSSFYLILNMGLGSSKPTSWPGPIDDANLPAKMEIDWVKVTKIK